MRFHLSEEQIAIQDTLYRALSSSLPRDLLVKYSESEDEIETASWKALKEFGVSGLIVAEEHGGSGLGMLEAVLAAETIGRAGTPGPAMGQILTGLSLRLTQNDSARAEWLAPLVAGEAVATFAFGGSWLPETWDVEIKDGKAFGSVRFVPGAGVAHVFLVGTKGGGLALIRAGENVAITSVRSSDRTRRLSTVVFDKAPAAVLFDPGDAEVSRVFDAGLLLLAADALGGAQFCVDLSVDYAKEREQFGRVIGQFQAVKHQLASMALSVEPARSLLWYAAYAWDNKLSDASRAAASVKAHLCDIFVRVARDAVAVHGGIGYTWEYGLNVWLRRSLFDSAVLGNPSVHRARAADMAGW